MKHNFEDKQVVILCGGQGTRIRAVAEDRPKPLVEIGGKPILWHIMKYYSSFGIRRFVLALGHQGEKIIDFFDNYHHRNRDFTFSVSGKKERVFAESEYNGNDKDVDDWEISMVHTGLDTMTGGRVKRVADYIDSDTFFCTYGDGLSDVNLNELMTLHTEHNATVTMTGVHLPTTFGIVEASPEGKVTSFREKPSLPGFINGGFFVMNKEIINHIEGDQTILENEPLIDLIHQDKVAMLQHEGFWHCMDHYKDYTTLNQMWDSGNSPWKIWS
jgi:glucose-1-phosphate cytidylyltransferase